MNLHWIDWSIVCGLLVFVTALAIYVKRYTKSVADFLSANRCAGRYLLSTAEGIASWGAISMVAVWGMYYKGGFSINWWMMMSLPVSIILGTTGFVIYRYRETRSMTVGQFFERRYSRKFRIFAQILAFTSGILNFGIFPSVGARFFMYYINLPETFNLFGFSVSTFMATMLFLISISLFFTFSGGQIAVIVTDFFQGFFCNIVFLIVLVVLFTGIITWGQIHEALASSAVEGKSLINPMQTSKVDDFSVWYFIIMMAGSFYSFMSWQGSQGYNSSAKSPHEAKMAKIVNGWKNYVQILLLFLLPIAIYTVMHHSSFAELAAGVNAVLGGIENETVRESMTVPIALAHFLPIGLKGALCAVVLSAFISTHDTYLHSWCSIFMQDVVMPFRKTPFSTKTHMLMLRISVTGVAIFIFVYSLLYRPTEHILMYFALTGAIYLGGAGSVLIGGLYWKRGTAMGAWGAMIVGSTLGLGALILRQWFWERWFGTEFPINGQWMYAITMVSSVTTYVVLSLVEGKICDMDKLFHRGKYKVESDHITKAEETDTVVSTIRPIWRKLGMNEEFSWFDKFLFFATIIFTLFWWAVFVIGTIYALIYKPSDDLWMKYWIVRCWIFFVIAVICTIWVGIGGIFDVVTMFRLLRKAERKADDDGFVMADGRDGTEE